MKKVFLRSVSWLPALLFLGGFFFYPFGRILSLSLDSSALAPANLERSASALGFTLYQALLSTILTLLTGLPAAWLFARFEFRGRSLLRAMTAVPFMLPTVVVAAAFNALLGPRGWLNLSLMALLDLDTPPLAFVGSLGAILLAHVFYNTTIVIRLVGNALAHLDPRLVQAARSLGGGPFDAMRRVTLPLLRPSLLAAALLVFLFDFTSFGVVLLLGGPQFATLEVETYIQAMHLLDLPFAALLSAIQLGCTLLFSLLYSRLSARRGVLLSPRPADSNLRRAKSLPARLFVAGMALLLAGMFVLPLLALPLRSVTVLDAPPGGSAGPGTGASAAYYRELFINRQDSVFYVPPIQAAVNSLIYAGLTVLLSLGMAFPAAAALSRPGRLERLLDPFLLLPLGASAVTLGLGFLVSFGKYLASPWMPPLAHTLIALPFVIRTLQPALASIPDRLRQAAAALGASPRRAWLAVDWPIIRRAALAGAVFAFTVSLGEFGATALVTRPEYPTLPVAIYRFLSLPGGVHYGQAMAMATLLLLLTTAGILLIERLRLPGMEEF
ncbi:MAG: iron ABC transporter permease [Chloroflexi bacterium]|nr:iron ABC transporter permease [Chloroflexota bacterium]